MAELEEMDGSQGRDQVKQEEYRQHRLQGVKKEHHREAKSKIQEQELKHPLNYPLEHSGCQASRMKPLRSISPK